MYREVKKIAQQGRNVVVEAPLYLWEGIDLIQCLATLEKTNSTYVLAYCPWNDLVNRIKQRNSSPNKKNHRELDWAMLNFVSTFDISPDYRLNRCFECLRGKQVHEFVTEYSQKSYKKKHLQLLRETQQATLKAFPQNTNYYVCPRFTYNITINTKKHNPEQGAQLVLDYIHKNAHFNAQKE